MISMRNYRKLTQLFYVFVIALTIWVIAPVMAGGGDPEAASQAWPMIEAGALVIDVRSPEEFAGGHLEGAINIQWHDSEAIAHAIGINKQRQVVMYCRSGNRANKSITKMKALGYNNIFNATGLEALKETRP
jgi:phage shock protein E